MSKEAKTSLRRIKKPQTVTTTTITKLSDQPENAESPKKKKKKLTQLELIKKSIDDNREFLDNWMKVNSEQKNSINTAIISLSLSLKKHEKTIKEIKEVHLTIEETLRNVLVAIRQNEYLQAYYPEQAGYPAMNVVGQHPIQAKRRRRKVE